MASVSVGPVLWRRSTPQVVMLRPSQRRRLAVFVRVGGIMGAALGVGLTAIASAPRADQAQPAAAPRMTTPAAATIPPVPEGLFQRSPLAAGTRFTPGGLNEASGFAPPAAMKPQAWIEEEFAQVSVLDGRTIEAGDRRIRLVGLDLPMAEQVCRTLDGRLEPCVIRAATQLELLTRWRRVTCHYRLETASDGIGRCRIGTNDLAERMIQTGYAWQSSDLAKPADP